MRTFIELELDERTKDYIREQQESIRLALAGACSQGCIRWSPIGNVHLTLRFLGETLAQQQAELSRTLTFLAQQWNPLNLSVSGLGCFPSMRQPKVIWLGVDGDMETLGDLQSEVERIVQEAGFKPDKRPFSPHLTIARARRGCTRDELKRVGQRIQKFMTDNGSGNSERLFVTSRVVHMHSDLRPSGAVYTPLSAHTMAD